MAASGRRASSRAPSRWRRSRARSPRERPELEVAPEAERRELAAIYQQRGLTRGTAEQVARELMAHDALTAHARDELGITEQNRARPLQAAAASMAAFCVGAGVPLAMVAVLPPVHRTAAMFLACVLLLMALGATGAWLGGARIWPAALRVGFWGVAAMGATAAIGRLFGVEMAG